MNKLFLRIASLTLGAGLVLGAGVAIATHKESMKASYAAETLALSWERSGTKDTVTSGFTFTAEATSKTGFYQDGGSVGNNRYVQALSETAIWSSAPVSISVSAKIGGGTAFDIVNPVYAVLLDSSGNEISSTKTVVTDNITNASGANYTDIALPIVSSAYGLRISHIKENNYNVRYYSFSLSFEAQSGKSMRIQNNTHAEGPFEVTYGDTAAYKYAIPWGEGESEPFKQDNNWIVSNPTVIDYIVDDYEWLAYKPKAVGTTTITVSHDGFLDASTTITVVPGTLQTLTVTGSMTKTAYSVGESWSAAGLTVTGSYDSGYSGNVTDDVEWTFSPAAPALGVTSVTATATIGTVSDSSAAQAVTVTRANPIQQLYAGATTNVDIYAYYVGFLDGTGPVVMDGAYGIVVYNKTAAVSGYKEGETILHVTGTISVYNGLYEVTSPSISEASGTYAMPLTPVVYTTRGGETQEYESRLTTVTGIPALYPDPDDADKYGDFNAVAGKKDIRMKFSVGTKEVVVFYKKAAQLASADTYSAMKSAVANSTEITVKGFTGWYNGFQVQMNAYVPPTEGYTAEDFAQELLDLTDAVCAEYDGYSNNHDTLEGIWSTLAGTGKYPSLPAVEKNILGSADADEDGTVVEQAMARYDYLTAKYSLSNFIVGRSPLAGSRGLNLVANNNALVIVIASSITVASLVGVLFIIRRRKLQK